MGRPNDHEPCTKTAPEQANTKVGRQKQYISVEVLGEGKALTIVFVYLPHNGSPVHEIRPSQDLYVELTEHVTQRQNHGPVIIIGDMNGRTRGQQAGGYAGAAWQRKTEDEEMNEHGTRLLQLLQILGMVILNGNTRYPDSWRHTFFKGKARSTIDYCCACPEDAEYVRSLQVGSMLGTSDHKPLWLCLQWATTRRRAAPARQSTSKLAAGKIQIRSDQES